MKISVDASELLKRLEQAKQKIKSKLEFMVQEVVYDALAVPAIDITPYGNLDKFYQMYAYRQQTYGFPLSAGLAKGGWNVRVSPGSLGSGGSMNTASPTFGIMAGMQVDTESGSLSKSRIQAQLDYYKLGNPVIVYNRIPYVNKSFGLGKSLESGYSSQAPQGIRIPTIDAFMGLYKTVMQRALSNV